MTRFLAVTLALVLTAPLAADGTSGTYKIDAAHSAVLFRIKHLGIAHFYGLFRSFSGQVVWDEADMSKSKISMSVDAESVVTGDKKRDAHVKSPDFLDTKQFATLSFESDKIEKKEGALYNVTGKMTVHGVTKEIAFVFELTGSGEDPWGGFRLGGEAIVEIKRSDFGMKHMLDKLGDDIRLTISVEGVREQAEKK